MAIKWQHWRRADWARWFRGFAALPLPNILHRLKRASPTFLVELDKRFGLDRSASLVSENQLPIEAYQVILWRAYPWRYANPPIDSKPILALTPKARVVFMRRRVSLGYATFAPTDISLAILPLGLGFAVSRRRNGSLLVDGLVDEQRKELSRG